MNAQKKSQALKKSSKSKKTNSKSNSRKNPLGKPGTVGHFCRTLMAKVGTDKEADFYIKAIKKEFKDSTAGPADVTIYRRQVRELKKLIPAGRSK